MPLRPWIVIPGLMLIAVLAAAIGATWLTEGGAGDRAAGLNREASDALPNLGKIPDFALTNQDGETVTDDQLRGRLWVADFIFTRCPSICPILSTNLARVQRWLEDQPGGDAVRLVSFSVDPEHDRPAVLRQFGRRHEADFSRWHFLTGPSRARMWRLSEAGFKLPVAENPPDATMPIMHSGKFVLVDASGRIRGYYGGTQSSGIEKLKDDLKQLLRAR